METTKVDRNRWLDLIKWLSSFMVVFIHVKFKGEFAYIVTALARFAVPLFFMISGFFTYKINAEKIRNRMLKLFLLYVIASVIYHSWAILSSIKDFGINGLFLYIKRTFTLNNLVCFLLFNVPFSSSHLWFLLSVIYVYAIWWLVVRFGDKFVLLLSCFCLFFHFILGNLLPILRVDLSIFSINNKLVLIRNWLLMGLPFFGFGYLTNKNKEKLFNIKWWGLICLIVFGFLETLIGYYFFGRFELYIGSTAIAFALIMVALKLEGKPINKLLVTLSSTSTDIYIYHIIISNAGWFILKFLKMDWSWLLLIWPVLVCCASVAFSLIKNTLFLLIKKKASP